MSSIELNPENKYKLRVLIRQDQDESLYSGVQIKNNQIVTIKVINRTENTQLANEEIEKYLSCRSDFNIQCKCVYKTDTTFWIIMDDCYANSIYNYVQHGFHLTESEMRDIIACCLLGLRYLHNNNILYCDIKPDNLCLSHIGTIQIGDFGLSAQLNAFKPRCSTIYGTTLYMAPETFKSGATLKSDIWSLGITIIELAEGHNPYANCTNDEIMKRIILLDPPSLTSSQWSSEFIDFINICLIKDMNTRPSVDELANHPFVKEAMNRIQNEGKSDILLQLLHSYESMPKSSTIDTNVKPSKVAKIKPSVDKETVLNIDYYDDFNKASNNPTFIHIIKVTSNRCNLKEITEWNIDIYSNLKQLIIGNNCFNCVQQWVMQDISVESIQIGANSFTHCLTFDIKQCNHLQSITIGDKSFIGCKQTDIEDCICLQTITLGNEVFSGISNNNTLIMKNLTALKEMIGKLKVFNKVNEVLIDDIPNLTVLQLPLAFMTIEKVSLQNASLFKQIPFFKNRYVTINKVNSFFRDYSTMQFITVSSNCCNERDLQTIDFSQFKCMKTLKIVIFENLEHLQKIDIGDNSFTESKDSWGQRRKQFICKNNHKLTRLTIGLFSFSDYSECIIERLPNLESIAIGKIDEDSYNFYYANFIISNLPGLQTITLGNSCFDYSTNTIIENLPQLKYIELGYYALCGRGGPHCTLTMKNLPNLIELISYDFTFKYLVAVTVESNHVNSLSDLDILTIKTVKLINAFEYITVRNVNNVAPSLDKAIPNPNVLSEQDLVSLSSSVNHILIAGGLFKHALPFNLDRFIHIQSLTIFNYNFNNNVDFILKDLPELKTVNLSRHCFENSVHTVIENLPQLKIIKLGVWTLAGDYKTPISSVTMRHLPALTDLISDGSSFKYCTTVHLDNIPNIKNVQLPYSFGKATLCTSHDVSSYLEDWIPNLKLKRFIQSTLHLDTVVINDTVFERASSLDLWGMQLLQTLQIQNNMLKDADFYLSNLPQLQTITLGDNCFKNAVHIVIKNLPQLKQIKLGEYALYGKEADKNCSLTMRNLPLLIDIIAKSCNFVFPHTVILENIPNINHVELNDPFLYVTHCIINNVSSCFACHVQCKTLYVCLK